MTLEEAIKTIQTWINEADDEFDREEMGRVDGLKMALHEIKKIEPCEDVVSREAVRKLICQNNDKYGYSDRFHEFTERCMQLPPITPRTNLALTSQDYISRQAVLSMQYRIDDSATLSTRNVVNVDDIEDLLSVNPQPKTGRWIEERDDYGELTHWHCSNCYDDSGFTTTCKWNYCPNCGADMRGDKDGNTNDTE